MGNQFHSHHVNFPLSRCAFSLKYQGQVKQRRNGCHPTITSLIRVGFVTTQHCCDSSDISLLILILFFYPEVNDDKCGMCFHFATCENVKCTFASELRLIGSGRLLRNNSSPTMDTRSLSQGLFSHTFAYHITPSNTAEITFSRLSDFVVRRQIHRGM